jgi:RimJ/RimL family protein N-acetyltransferase
MIPFEGGALRPLSIDDAPALATLINDRDIWLQLRDRVPHPFVEEDARNFISRTKADPPLVLGITTEHQLSGVIGAYPFADVERFGAEIGYWLGSPFQGKGIATNALRAFVPYVFRSSELSRLQACVFQGNAASMRVLIKCGFTAEGILRKAVTKDGRKLDMHVFGLLRKE